jgi:hypothetical protein
MNDTDRLIAAIFAATMTAKETAPEPRDFFGYYDKCIAETLDREALESARKAAKTIDAHNKAWG